MEMQYVEEHLRCFNYESDERPLIEISCLAKNERKVLKTSNNKLIFVASGELKYDNRTYIKSKATNGRFIFVPAKEVVNLTSTENSTKLIIIRLDKPVRFCVCYFIEKLKNEVEGNIEIDERVYPDAPIKEPVDDFIRELSRRIKDGLRCRYFFELKVTELFYLLRAYYTKEELSFLFIHCMGNDSKFEEKFMSIFQSYNSISEIAAAMNYTLKGFEKKFKKVYGIPPYQWIKQRKMIKLHWELTSGDKNLKTLATEFGFAGPPQLNDFCKKNFNTTPGKLRESSKNRYGIQKDKKGGTLGKELKE